MDRSRDCLILALACIAGALVVAILGVLCLGCGEVVPEWESDWSWPPEDADSAVDETPETPDAEEDIRPDISEAEIEDAGSDDAPEDAEEGTSLPDGGDGEAEGTEDAGEGDEEATEAEAGLPCVFCGEGSADYPTCAATYRMRLHAGNSYQIDGCMEAPNIDLTVPGASCRTRECWTSGRPLNDVVCDVATDTDAELCVLSNTPQSWCYTVTGGPCEAL